jgi:hypothetical protein
MVYIDVKKSSETLSKRLELNEADIKIEDVKITHEDNWGDDDCIKMVSDVAKATIKISANVAKDFEDVTSINFIRYNYYQPAYHLVCALQSKETMNNGSIVFKYA